MAVEVFRKSRCRPFRDSRRDPRRRFINYLGLYYPARVFFFFFYERGRGEPLYVDACPSWKILESRRAFYDVFFPSFFVFLPKRVLLFVASLRALPLPFFISITSSFAEYISSSRPGRRHDRCDERILVVLRILSPSAPPSPSPRSISHILFGDKSFDGRALRFRAFPFPFLAVSRALASYGRRNGNASTFLDSPIQQAEYVALATGYGFTGLYYGLHLGARVHLPIVRPALSLVFLPESRKHARSGYVSGCSCKFRRRTSFGLSAVCNAAETTPPPLPPFAASVIPSGCDFERLAAKGEITPLSCSYFAGERARLTFPDELYFPLVRVTDTTVRSASSLLREHVA